MKQLILTFARFIQNLLRFCYRWGKVIYFLIFNIPIKLYLDDERYPKSKGWIIVRNYKEFVIHIKIVGLPIEMSLDHDLGDNTPSGFDCVKWMVEKKQLDLRNVSINVHSANPVGKENMESLINNWIKHLNEEDKNEHST